jgi:hypothetical protein
VRFSCRGESRFFPSFVAGELNSSRGKSCSSVVAPYMVKELVYSLCSSLAHNMFNELPHSNVELVNDISTSIATITPCRGLLMEELNLSYA